LTDIFHWELKVSNRAYACDETIEARFVAPEIAKSSIGQLTGMDFYSLFSKWYPEANDIEDRPVDGMYLLQKLPNKVDFCIKEYEKDSVDTMVEVLSAVSCELNEDDDRQEWQIWLKKHGTCVAESEHLKRFTTPLKMYLKSTNILNDSGVRVQPIVGKKKAFPNYINGLCAMAMPSVTCSLNIEQHVSRVYVDTDDLHLNAFVAGIVHSDAWSEYKSSLSKLKQTH
jgi:hypothetical protein